MVLRTSSASPTTLVSTSGFEIVSYLRARYYDPATAQFLSRDPMVATTRSPYGYVAGNPLNQSDPWGLFATTGGENSSPDDPWFSWSQAIQDSYIRARGQLQGLQDAQVQLQEHPDNLFNSNRQVTLIILASSEPSKALYPVRLTT